MKIPVAIIGAIFVVGLFSCKESAPQKSIIGIWGTGELGRESTILEFQSDGRIQAFTSYFSTNGEEVTTVSTGKWHDLENDRYSVKFDSGGAPLHFFLESHKQLIVSPGKSYASKFHRCQLRSDITTMTDPFAPISSDQEK